MLKRLHSLSDEGTVLTVSIGMLLSASSGSQRLPVFGSACMGRCMDRHATSGRTEQSESFAGDIAEQLLRQNDVETVP